MNASFIPDLPGLRRSSGGWSRGTCPRCGRDSFAITTGRTRPRYTCHYLCTQSELREVLARAGAREAIVPRDEPGRANQAKTKAEALERAMVQWNGAGGTRETPAEPYLIRRGLRSLLSSTAIRFRDDASHPGGGGRRHMAMLAAVHLQGKLIAIQRTYLTRDGKKAPLDPPRAALGHVWAGGIFIDPVSSEMVVGEGLETSASAGILLGLPAIAAISAKNLERGLVLPGPVRSIVIAADHDDAGITAAEGAARRWQAEGRRVRVVKPHEPGLDFNDLLMRRLARAVK